MITDLFINFFVLAMSVLFSWTKVVTKIPNIIGYDIDSALSNAMGQFTIIGRSFWFLKDLVLGFIAIMGYYLLKMTLKFFLGHRAPGTH